MGIKLSDYINDENRKLTPEQIRQFLIEYGFDEDMTVREFDDEMYELLKQTGKTDIRIITDPSIRMEDE